MVYRLIFGLAALYNIAFGIWACVWPEALFASFEMAPPNYPSLWQCLSMVVGLYGVLYAYAAIYPNRAKPIIAIGLAGKLLGPIGMFIAFRSGEWPLHAVTLIVFNDFVWWLPFTLFLFDETRMGERLRAGAPWMCAVLNATAAIAMLFALRGGTEAVSSIPQRATYIAGHTLLWRTGWVVWMMAGISLVAFFYLVGRLDLITSSGFCCIGGRFGGSCLRSLCRIASHRLATQSNRHRRAAGFSSDWWRSKWFL
jgi:hypothetical protein